MIAKFTGKVTSIPSVTNIGIIVTHPTAGRFSKSITAAQKNAAVQFTGI